MAKPKKWKALTEEEKRASLKNYLLFIALAVGLVLIDLLSKWIVQIYAPLRQEICLIPNFLYIYKDYNTAIAFSMGSSMPEIARRIINLSISLIASTAIATYWFFIHHRLTKLQKVIAALLLAGAFGNLIDRAFYWKAITGFDGVIDFVRFYLGGGPNAGQNFVNPFATFNFADSYLVVGIIILIVLAIIDMVKESKKDDLSVDPRLYEKKEEDVEAPASEPVKEEVKEEEPKEETPKEETKE